jgi:glycosyltransferase 2 family protein
MTRALALFAVPLPVGAELAATLGWQTVRSAADEISGLAPGVVTLAVALYAANVLFYALRWQAAVRALGAKVSLTTATLGTLCSVFLNNVTPATVAGDLFRIGWLRFRDRIPVAPAAASVAIDRFIDLVTVALIGLFALPTLRPLLGRPDTRTLVLGGLVVVLVLLLLERHLRSLSRRLGQLRNTVVESAQQPVRRLAMGLAFGLLAWGADLARVSVIAAAFGVHLGLPQAAVLCVAMVLGSLAPTFGGLGAVEGGLVAALVWFGAPVQTAVAITIVERSVSFGLSSALGGATILLLGGRKLVTTVSGVLPAARTRPV